MILIPLFKQKIVKTEQILIPLFKQKIVKTEQGAGVSYEINSMIQKPIHVVISI